MASLLLSIVLVLAGLVWFGEANGMLNVPALEPLGFGGGPSSVPTTARGFGLSATASPTLLPVLPPIVPSLTSLPTAADLSIQPTYSDPSPDTPTPITTAEGWCGHQLDEPFGPGNKLVIHRLGGGDSLNRFEITYRTSVRAIEGVNLPFRIPVPRDTVLVIPVDTTEVGDLPLFEPVLVSMRNTPIETMAFKVKADLLAFEKYNGFDESCRDFIGWVVAPRERAIP